MKLAKRILSLGLAIGMMLTMSVGVSAGSQSKAMRFYSGANTGYVLNPYTDGTPVNGTNVTVYRNMYHSNEQHFWTRSGSLFSYLNGENPTLRVASSYGNAIFRPTTYDNSLALIGVSPFGNLTKIFLAAYPDDYVLTATSIADGGNVVFQEDYGLRDYKQYWEIGL